MHPSKHQSPIEVIPCGSKIELSLVQPRKHVSPMEWIDGGRLIDSRCMHPMKHLLGMVDTEVGIYKLVSAEQP